MRIKNIDIPLRLSVCIMVKLEFKQPFKILNND